MCAFSCIVSHTVSGINKKNRTTLTAGVLIWHESLVVSHKHKHRPTFISVFFVFCYQFKNYTTTDEAGLIIQPLLLPKTYHARYSREKAVWLFYTKLHLAGFLRLKMNYFKINVNLENRIYTLYTTLWPQVLTEPSCCLYCSL